jgi:2-polyprenyl-3-methyl-5-hydroxy-6-metoxy-1,4-benzoquinol methylase
MGHNVLGVDMSPTGVSQMLEEAERSGLRVEGVVADLIDYKPPGMYDVVLLDRVLHMFEKHSQRMAVLEKAASVARQDGYILIADMHKNIPRFRSFFDEQHRAWEIIKADKGILFVRRSKTSEWEQGEK